jgi:serine/threonine-protein kinase RsbW
VLRNHLTELNRLAVWIEGWAESSVFPDISFALQLCLEEAVANVIMYGASDGELEIAVELERRGETLVAQVEDNGRPFDPTQIQPPWPATSLKDAKIGDLGIHLLRSFAGHLEYERRNGRNRLTLRFDEPQAVLRHP